MEVAAAADNSADSSQTDDQRAEKRNYHQLDKVIVQVARASVVPSVADVVRRMLARRHNQVVDFEITVPELLLKQEQRTKTIFNVVLGAIASISLIVGGIGIVNIMLVSVTERTREIGIRLAIGALAREVRLQFLTEAVVLCSLGGAIGIGLSFGLSVLLTGIMEVAFRFDPLVNLGSLLFSSILGILFGYVPAQRAAALNPIDALRHE
jgi:putative ABC transport system permease protein